MTAHDWQLVPIINKVKVYDDLKITISNIAPGVNESYICSRCGDKAQVTHHGYTNDKRQFIKAKHVTENWNNDCDEFIIHQIHEL